LSTDLIKQETTSPLVGMQIITAAGELFNHVDENGPMWAGDGDREVRVEVRFSAIFQRPPHISLGISGIDSSMAQNLRFSLVHEAVTTEGFEIVMKTWSDTKIARASVNWSAIGQAVPSSAIRR
jgi:H-type lectin domain-containing protein